MSLRGLDRMLSLSGDGVLVCEGGVMLAEILDVLLPRGWFPPVTPGTRFVTLGGMIASDVHGKNHHGAGSFCDHVLWVDLALGDGGVRRCSRDEDAELFAATCGGMGLTGVIVRAAVQLVAVDTAWIRQQTLPAADLDEACALMADNAASPYSVAWIDGLASGPRLGRAVVFLGAHARPEDLPGDIGGRPLARPGRPALSVPVDLPEFALSRPTVRAFNALYVRAHRAGTALVGLDAYFYPLDAVGNWNRIYGRRGFVQYQPVLPLEDGTEGLRRLLEEVARRGQPSFLSVLKRMGAQSSGLLSFPQPGHTLTLDFPATPENLSLLDRLDAIVAEHGGRLYLTKDARMTQAMFEAGYPRAEAFRDLRRRLSLDRRFASLQSRRLGL